MKLLKIYPLLLLVFLSISCSQENKTSDCDKLSSSEGTLSDNSFDCPTGNPSNDDILVENLPQNLKIEAGTTFGQIITLKNTGSAKIFDFEVVSDNLEIQFNNCPSRFNPNNSCSIQVRISKEQAGSNQANILIKDRTGKLNKIAPFNYKIIASYPQSVDYSVSEVDFKTKRVIVGPLIDRFGNKVDEIFNISANRNLANTNLGPYNSLLLQKAAEIVTSQISFFVQTDQLETTQVLDSADVTFFSPRVYEDGTIINKILSLSFLNNKPQINTSQQPFTVVEDSTSNLLYDLFKGQDSRGFPLTYKIVTFPQKGILANCLSSTNFISLVNCSYVPSKDYFGEDFFTYKVNNGEADSLEIATVKITVTPINDSPVLSGFKNIEVNEKQANNIQLVAGFDPDGDQLSYVITQTPIKGTLVCTGINCIYTPNGAMLGSDSIKYKAKDPMGLESSEFIINILIKDVNESPVLGGSETHNLNENQEFNFIVGSATDPDLNDTLKYKIKTNVTKGKLSGCLTNNDILNCKYVPNKYENTADFFTYVAYDLKGLESEPRTITLTINQINSSPYFTNAYQEVQTLSNVAVNFTLLTAIDPESNTINYSRVTDVAGGILANCIIGGNNNLNCTYTPPAGVNNSEYFFTYKAQDSAGALSELRTVKILIKNSNDLPQLVGPFSISTNEDEEFPFNLKKGTDTESPQDALRYQIGLIRAQNGTLSGCMNLAGSEGSGDTSCIYKPNENYNGSDSFSYLVLDGSNFSSLELTATISVVPVNDAPKFAEDSEELILQEDIEFLFTLKAATDIENNPISYRLKAGFSPEHLELDEHCFTSVGQLMSCKIIPDQDYSGEDRFIIEAVDSLGTVGEKLFTIKILPVNDAPRLISTGTIYQVEEDTQSIINLPIAIDIDTQSYLLKYEIVTQPTKGVLSGCLNIGSYPGTKCIYQSRSNEIGHDSFSYRTYDGELYSNTITVNLNINETNDAPYFERTRLGPFKVERGTLIILDIEKARDIENDNITYQITTQPTQGVIEDCFSGEPIKCEYRPNEDATGIDSIVYNARDTENSINSVQIDFIIEDKRVERLYKLDNNNNLLLGQKQSLSVDKNIYELGTSLLFNASSANNGYSTNFLYFQKANGDVQSVGNAAVSNKSVIHDEKLFIFDESSTGNKIRSIDKNGVISESSYVIPGNIFFPVSFNHNIYTGSNSTTLYKVNILNIDSTNLSYLEPLITKEKLGVQDTGKLIEIIKVFDEDLYFTYIDDNNLKKLAKIDILGNLTKISQDNGLNSAIINNFYFYKNASSTVKKIFFTAGTSSEKRLMYYDILLNEVKDVPGSSISQSGIANPQLYKIQEQDFLIYYNSLSKKVFGLQADIGLLFEYEEEMVRQVVVSSDHHKILIIKDNNSLKYTDENPLLGFKDIDGLSVEKAYSFIGDRFLLKRYLSSELYSLDEQNAFSQLILPPQYQYNDNTIVTSIKNRAFFYSPRSTVGGQVHDLYEYKTSLSFDVIKGTPNTLLGLIPANAGGQYSIIAGKEPLHGQIENCMGLNGSALSSINCKYIPNSGYIGRDNFTYRIQYSPSLFNDYLVTLNISNTKPEILDIKKKETFATISNLGMQITEYIVVDDEIYFAAEKAGEKSLYRYNQAEELRLIKKNIAGYSTLKYYEGYIYFTDKSVNNKIYSFDVNSKTIQLVFQDGANNGLLIIDSVFVGPDLYMIAKNYGNPASNRLIKFNINTSATVPLVLPLGYENGRFIPTPNSFFIETESSFALFNKVGNVFTDTTNFTIPNQPGRAVIVDADTVVFALKSTSGSLSTTTYKAYSITRKVFFREEIFNFFGETFKSELFPTFNAGGSLATIIEMESSTGNSSSTLLFRKGLLNENNSPVLSGPLQFNTLLREFNSDIWYISRDSTWNNIQFRKYGITHSYNVLNNSVTALNLPSSIDKDLDTISYEIIEFPSRGTLSECLGINNKNDTSCLYTHTDTQNNAVVDVLKYRIFDGYEYSSVKTINLKIKNSAPFFENVATQELSTPQTIPLDFVLNNAVDFDNNPVYYLITTLPTKGVITQCISSLANIANSTRNCQYTPNSGQTGLDTLKYRAYDGLSFSEELTVQINITNSPNPIFLSANQDSYMPNTNGSYLITLEKALDPQGLALTYQIQNNPEYGTLSNCLVINFNKLQCTYTPTNPNLKLVDTFTYIASNGSFQSLPRTVKITVTTSSMTGLLGKFEATNSGPILTKDGLNNISALESIPGYNWNFATKTLTLPANREYQFESFFVDDLVKIIIKPFNTSGVAITNHGWTKIYSQSTCTIDGQMWAYGALTTGTIQTITDTGIDSESLSYIVQPYSLGTKGGSAGSSSQSNITPGEFGTATLFKSANGQVSTNSDLSEALGGLRGKDGLGLFIKCLDEVLGSGVIKTNGENGEAGRNGMNGYANYSSQVSFGGGGGAGGGNGGQGGQLRIRTSSNNFNGLYSSIGGDFGLGGYGGLANLEFIAPIVPTDGVDGKDGKIGVDGICQIGNITGALSACN